MLFNSLEYFVFLPIVLLGFYVATPRQRLPLLLAASLFFYMYWRVPYVVILLGSAALDYCVALGIQSSSNQRTRRALVIASLAANLGVLAFFKYWNFFVDTLVGIGVAEGALPAWSFLLPMGISFYTFQTMSYTIDVYRRELAAERSFLTFLLYITFFPQLVAGPIERASRLIPQFRENIKFEWDNLWIGGRRILAGLIKKAVIADQIATLVDPVYANPDDYSAVALLFATYAFAVQIYCDFSGYSDIGIGTARLMGFRLMENFEAPYISRSIQEFWRRWHISLSTWLRDYLYVSLGGNRRGAGRTYANLAITMLLGGLWHGASWNFVIWGALHGSWLAAERALTRRSVWQPSTNLLTVRGALQAVLVFHGVCATWVFFRAQTLPQAATILDRIVTFSDGVHHSTFSFAFTWLIAGLGSLYFVVERAAEKHLLVRWCQLLGGCLLLVLFGVSNNEFIYFVF